ncbi:hypothetical protein [Fontivita pretiosa]|uniref:hypothetical protein n=1 Tax=Fontivita pretiosa TaxID=2989684 RepID=UPI003D173297
MPRARRRNGGGPVRAIAARAFRPVVEQLEKRMLLAVQTGIPNWLEQGPGPVTGANTGAEIPPDNPAAGAVEALATPPHDPRIVFAGTVSGGVWRSLNATSANPTWQPLTDRLASLSIGAIALGHFDADGNPITRNTPLTLPHTKLVVYAGYGRVSSGSRLGGPRVGLVMSSDGGEHWTPIGGKTFNGLDIRSIVPSRSDRNTILVAARSRPGNSSNKAGVWLSSDGGKQFRQVFAGEVSHLVGDPGNANRFYAAVPGRGVFRSASGGASGSWTAVNNGLAGFATASRIELAVHHSAGGNVVYAGIIGSNQRATGVFRSTNQGANWTPIPNLPSLHPGSQGGTHFALVADPSDPNIVFVSGDRDTALSSGNVWRADISSSGNPWTQVVYQNADPGGTIIGTAPHADSRDMVFNALGDLLHADDGGIYRLNNPNGISGLPRFWDSRNGNLRAVEFWSAAYNPLHGTMFGGTQDIGVAVQRLDRGLNWRSRPSGDGGIAQINTSTPGQVTYYYSSQNLGGFREETYDAAGNLVASLEIPLAVNGAVGRTLTGSGILRDSNGNRRFDNTRPFLTQYALSATNPTTRMLIGTSYLYESFDGGATLHSLGGIDVSNVGDNFDDDGDGGLDTAASPDRDEVAPLTQFGRVTAIAYGGFSGGVPAPDVAYVAAGKRLAVRTSIATANAPALTDFTDRAVYSGNVVNGGDIRDIVLDPREWRTGYLVDDNGDVFRLRNAGAAAGDWTRITGSLKKLTTDLRSVEVIVDQRLPAGIAVIVAGRGGVYGTFNPGENATWFKVGRGLPNVLVTDVRYDRTDVLHCGSWGRGAWRIDNFLATIFGPALRSRPEPVKTRAPSDGRGILQISGDEQTNKDDTIRLVLDEANPQVLNVFVNNTTNNPDFVIDASAVHEVQVSGGQGNDTLLIDHANGLVSFPGGITFDETAPGARQDINQTPISSGVVGKLRDGLAGLANWGAKIAQLAELTRSLPGLGKSLADTLSIGDGTLPIGGALQRGLVQPIQQYFTNDLTPTAQELADLLKTLSTPLGNITFGVDPVSIGAGLFTDSAGQQELRFDLALHLDGFAGQLPLDFASSVESLGLNFTSSGKVDLSTRLNLDFSFGVNLAPNLSDAEAFFIRVNDLSAGARVSAGQIPVKAPIVDDDADLTMTGEAINVEVNLGFLGARIVNGAVKLDASVRIDVQNPDADDAGRITLTELTGTSISSLLDVSAAGTLDVNLPFRVSLAGVKSEAEPVLKISSSDLFGSAPQVTTENFDRLLDFRNISASNMLALLRQLAAGLGRISDSPVFDVPIPFTSKSLGEAIDFAASATTKLTDPLVDSSGQPNFTSAQDLAVRLAVALGLDPSTINLRYDPATKDLTYRVSFAHAFSGTAAINLGTSLAPVAELGFSSQFDLEARAGADFTFGVNLTPLQGEQTLGDKFFIQNATLAGSVNLSASDIDALARIGFLGIGVENGNGTLAASAMVQLQNPSATLTRDSDGTANRVSLAELLGAVLNNPSALIRPAQSGPLMPGVSVNVSQMAGNQMEPVIVIDPTDPRRMFIASNRDRAGSMMAAVSSDGGATWTSRLIATGPTSGGGDGFDFGCCDPAATFDRFGNLYFAYLNNPHDKVIVLISSDGGQSFSLLREFTVPRPAPNTTPKLDRPVLASGPGDSPDNASVWLAFRDDTPGSATPGIVVAGARVSAKGKQNVGAFGSLQSVPGSSFGNFPDLAVGPRGQVLVAWQFADITVAEGPSTISVSLDPDGLNTAQGFGPAQLVTNTNVGPKDGIPAQPDRKITAAPRIGYALAGPYIGRAYVLYTDEKLDSMGHETSDTNIVLRYSDKDGAMGSWSKPVGVSIDSGTNSQFFGQLAVDPKTGYVAASWYDARNDPMNKKVQLFATVSTDGGASFRQNTQVSLGQSDQAAAEPHEGTNIDFGDYTGLAFFDGSFYPAWADNATTAGGKFDIYTCKITVSSPSSPAPLRGRELEDSGIQFTGSAQAELPIKVDGGFISLPGDARVTINWSDLSDPGTLDVQFVNLEDALNFEGLTFDTILAALQQVVDYLGKLRGFGFLNNDLPLLNVSVGEALDYAQRFNEKLQQLRDNPAGSVQTLAAAIEAQFGLPAGSVQVSLDGDNLKTQLEFKPHFDVARSLNFDIGSLLSLASGPVANLGGVLNISGSASLSLVADAELKLDLGVDLSDPLNPVPFLYDTTKLSINGGINAMIPQLTVAIGPLGAEIRNGSASLTADFDAVLLDVDMDGRHLFSELATLRAQDVKVDLAGMAHVDLPIYFPIGTALMPSLVIDIPSLAELFRGTPGSVTLVSAPDLSGALNLDLLNDLSGLLDGLDRLLALLQGALDSKAFGRNMPLVGTKLKDGAQVIGTFRSDVINRLRPFFEAADPKNVSYVRNALFSVLGPGTGGLNVLGDLNGDTLITADDIRVVMDHPTAPNDVRFDLLLSRDPVVISTPLNLDIGIPALRLQTNGSVNVAMGFDFAMGIGLNRSRGVYFDTTAANELKLDFDVSISGFTGAGQLALLKISAADSTSNPTHFGGMFTVDLADADNKLTINELGAAAITARLNATANVNLGLNVSFGNDARFPSLLSDFRLNWVFDNDTTDAVFGGAPRVAFENIRLRLGSFFSNFASPVLGEVKRVLAPLQPLVDLLDTNVPMLAKVDSVRNFFDINRDGVVKMREVVQKLDPSPVFSFIDGITALNNLVNAIPGGSTSYELVLGRFDLNNVPDLRNLTSLENTTLTNLTQANVNAQLQSQAPGFASALNNPNLGTPGSAGGGKFEMPIIQSPAQVFKLLLGQDVELFRWQMPVLDLNLSIQKSFPIIGPIAATFGGAVGIRASVGFGYDTFGLREWRRTGNESLVREGFFLIDKPAGGSTDPAEITATGQITIGAGVDVVIASAFIEGSIRGTLNLNLDDPNDDGKVRFKELSDNFDQGVLCIFDVDGSLSAGLRIRASVGVWPFKKSFNYDSPRIELLSFEHECKDDATAADPILATDIGGGVLRLNMGPHAAARMTVNTLDGNEQFVVEPDPDNPGSVLVKAFGFAQSFAGITKIQADGGNGDDSIFIDPRLTVTAQLSGGGGNDTITAGGGSATLNGNDGDDQLSGGAAGDQISGDAGNDTLIGADANDLLIGGANEDALYGDAGDDTLNGGTEADQLWGGSGADSMVGGDGNDTLHGEAGGDNLSGSAGDDELIGGDDNDVLLGADGLDSLAGDGGNDTLDGGNDADGIYGGEGDDSASGRAGNDRLFGEAGNDTLNGDGDDDSLFGGQGHDSLSGGAGADQLFGEAGDDTASGGDGNDTIAGDEGNDRLDGQNDHDSITGGSGADSILGGGGNDTISGDEDADTVLGGSGADSIDGGTGADLLQGGSGADTIHGQQDNDLIDGQDDPDNLFGDAGNDTITGGTGADTVEGGADQDSISGDTDADLLFGNAGDDTIHGNAGNDTARGGSGSDILFGDDGSDWLFGDSEPDIIFGDEGQVVLASALALRRAGAGADAAVILRIESINPSVGGDDRMFGLEGDDTMLGGFGGDQIDGGPGDNIMLGDNGLLSYIIVNKTSQLVLITTTDPTLGASDEIIAQDGNDSIMGGTAAETIRGGAGDDLIFGDHGKIDYTLPANANFISIDTGGGDGGGNDVIFGEAGDDTVLGGQAADIARGGGGDDDLIGGHNVAGADGADQLDGGEGSDAIVGDNGSIVRRTDASSPRFRTLAGGRLYDSAGNPAVGAAPQPDPAGSIGRDIILLDHSSATGSERFGGDSIAGGAGNDCVFGGLGNDTIQGDGSIALLVSATTPSTIAPTDGDDYIEGNGGQDLIFGNGGQDDIVGGSSGEFGLSDSAMRPDGSDLIFGGAGNLTARNDPGDTTIGGHAADADCILADNGTIYRVVRVDGSGNSDFVRFNYDNYAGSLRIIPRAVRLLDYTAGTGAGGDLGAADTVYGEAGDDVIHGQVGNDVLFGDGQDDDLFGGIGHDRMYGGSGEDGMVGDDGLILISRNGLSEPLYGISSPNLMLNITLPGMFTGAWTFITGRLHKMARLMHMSSGGNDLMYGGLGDDFMHGGAGDDALSGAEAQAQWYNARPVGAAFFAGLFNVADPTNPLGYDPATTTFAAYDNSTSISPMRLVANFFLNFDATDASGAKILDGKDRLFGDGGNDWLVGGTMNDRAFGGAGDDVMNNDDNLQTNGGLNDRPDSPAFADRDFAFGGTGRDALIANTGGDRMFDWHGEYNSFFVPFSVFGEPTLFRRGNPGLVSFLLALGRESGADVMLSEPNGELGLSAAGDSGEPRDEQPGNVPGVPRDTFGAPEDDRWTALPLGGALGTAPSLSPSPSQPAEAPDGSLASGDSTATELLQLSGGTVSLGDGAADPMDWTQAGDALELLP